MLLDRGPVQEAETGVWGRLWAGCILCFREEAFTHSCMYGILVLPCDLSCSGQCCRWDVRILIYTRIERESE